MSVFHLAQSSNRITLTHIWSELKQGNKFLRTKTFQLTYCHHNSVVFPFYYQTLETLIDLQFVLMDMECCLMLQFHIAKFHTTNFGRKMMIFMLCDTWEIAWVKTLTHHFGWCTFEKSSIPVPTIWLVISLRSLSCKHFLDKCLC